MTGSRVALGDSHNFGRRVLLKADRVLKPRTVFWEWLVLAADSPLRQFLREAAVQDGLGADAFDFLPTLKFYATKTPDTGAVQRLRLQPLRGRSGAVRRALSVIVGRSLALWSWLGVADLHWENLALGVDHNGQIVFGPLDVEMMLADLSLPTETKLLPDADPEYAEVCRHACGVRRVLPYLGKPIAAEDLLAMAAAYRATLEFLDRRANTIAKVLAGVPGLSEAPLRVLLRGTADYVNAETQPLWPPLLESEIEQLARGDIPYFFRLYGRPGIHYFGERTLSQLKRLPLRGDVPQLDPLLQLSRGLRSPTRKRLSADGLFTLLGAFDDASLTGKHQNHELAVTFGARRLVVQLGDGEELAAPRNLSPFVGSVYLPCRCGEVRSVLVPAVTKCRLAGGAR